MKSLIKKCPYYVDGVPCSYDACVGCGSCIGYCQLSGESCEAPILYLYQWLRENIGGSIFRRIKNKIISHKIDLSSYVCLVHNITESELEEELRKIEIESENDEFAIA